MDTQTEALLKQLSDINIFTLNKIKLDKLKLKNTLAELDRSIKSLKITIASTKHLIE